MPKLPPPLDFEPVSVDDARKSLERGLGVLPESFGEPESPEQAEQQKLEKLAQRRPPTPAETQLADETLSWLARLPAEVRPEALPRRFARIANRLAQLWPDRDACCDYLQSLIFSDRPDRQGFPLDVGREIALLLQYRQDGSLPFKPNLP